MYYSEFDLTGQVLGLIIIRIWIGIIFIIHGYEKIKAGRSVWIWCGQQMLPLGMSPLFWGIMAVGAEFLGGICLVLGIYTRIASFFLIITMMVATHYHAANKDDFSKISHPLSLLGVFLGLLIAGNGAADVDIYSMLAQYISYFNN